MNLNVKQKERKKQQISVSSCLQSNRRYGNTVGKFTKRSRPRPYFFQMYKKETTKRANMKQSKTDSITRIQFVVKWYAIFRAWNIPPKSDKKRKKAHIIHNCTVRRITTRPVSATHQAIRKQSALNFKNTPVKPGNLGFPKLQYFAASQNKQEFVGK